MISRVSATVSALCDSAKRNALISAARKFTASSPRCGQHLAAGHDADAQEIRHRVAAGDQQMDGLGRDRLILVRHHRGLDHAADQRLIAFAVAADRGELHVAWR